MRVYNSINIIGINAYEHIDNFKDRLSKAITNFQKDGYGVEVQFQTNNSQCVALLLQYKEV